MLNDIVGLISSLDVYTYFNRENTTSWLSAIGTIGSFCVAWRVKKNSEVQREQKFRSDLYFVTTQFVSVDHYLAMMYDARDTVTRQQVLDIIDSVKNVNKNIIDPTSSSFYNDAFDKKLLGDICMFFQTYSTWIGWNMMHNTDIFKEIYLMSLVRKNALEVLQYINEKYGTDERIRGIIGNFSNVSSILNNINKYNCAKYIAHNLVAVFITFEYMQMNLNHTERNNIIAGLLKIILTNKVYEPHNNEIIKYLFTGDIEEPILDPKYINFIKSEAGI